MQDFEVKLSTEKQFDDIWHIFQDVVHEGDTFPFPPGITKEEAKSHWYEPDSKVYIAYLKDKPVATRYIKPNKLGLGSHIANTGVMIDKNYRGHGLGRKMMEFAIEETKKLGYKAIQLNLVVSTNIASITICKSFGFETIGKIPDAFFYKQKKYVDAFVMYKKL